MNKHEVGQKVWDTHNNCVWTLKSSEEKYGTTMWHVEENDYEWREDWFADIPKYVQELIDKCEATENQLSTCKIERSLNEKMYEGLKRDVKQVTSALQKFRFNKVNDMTYEQIDLLLEKLSKVNVKDEK